MKNLIYFFICLPMFVFAQSEFEQAELLLKQGKYDQARVLFLNQYSKNPNNIKVTEYLGDIEGHFKNWVKAQEYYQKLRDAYPTNANYHFKYGGVFGMQVKEMNKFRALANIEDLKSNFEKAIKYNPNHIEERWALIEIYIQLPSMVGGSEAKAQAYATQLLKISEVDGYLSRGHIAEYFERYTEAELNFKKAIEVSGGSRNSYKRLINLYRNKMKQPEKANQIQSDYNKKYS